MYRLKKFVHLILSITLLISVFAWTKSAPIYAGDDCDIRDNDDDGYVSQIILGLQNPSNTAALNSIITTYNLTIADTTFATQGVYLLDVAEGNDADIVSDQIETNYVSALRYIEANYLGDIPEANPSGNWAWGGQSAEPAQTQYAAQLLNLQTAQNFTLGDGVTVAVIDTGIQTAHPWFSDRIVNGYDFIDNDTTPEDIADGADSDGDGTPNEAVGHGTHVAGIVHFVAPQANIMPIRVLDGDGWGDTYRIALGIHYAIENGADIISLSLGSTYKSDLFEELVEAAHSQGIVVVAAAGNAQSDQPQFPAAYEDEVMAVTSVDENMEKAPSANWGCWVDLAASGEEIFSAFPIDEYAWWSGTSMATPFVAGQAALIKSVQTSARQGEIESIIRQTAVNIDSANSGFETLLGAGLVDVGASVEMLMPPTAVAVSEINTHSNVSVLLPLFILTTSTILGIRLAATRRSTHTQTK